MLKLYVNTEFEIYQSILIYPLLKNTVQLLTCNSITTCS